MDEPWYESQGPNIEYAKNDIYSNINMYLSRFPQLTSENIKQIFDNEIHREYDKYNGFGSLRGYEIFTRRGIIESIEDKLLERASEINNAFCKLKNNVI